MRGPTESGMHDPFVRRWEQDRTTRAVRQEPLNRDDAHQLRAVESMVSAVLRQRFSFVLIRAEEKATRLRWESQLIATVSLCPECEPSPQWLGQYSPVHKIRESGLWLIKGLYGQPLDHEHLTQIESSNRSNCDQVSTTHALSSRSPLIKNRSKTPGKAAMPSRW